ncbi:hypothetical protein A0H81_07346 [Grifola frondosa]|uniref:Major facilitator superfamily (MFS) profile domain-containing protein n=1 Tax=Grifola frondosa TaxID=5627 RepID=A0A1C7M5V7_GRIFR|nr:hypothetical protein A0H81_07346 [Grifola frondosa]
MTKSTHSRRNSGSSQCDPAASVITDGLQKEEQTVPSPHQRSTFKAICLVATCTLAMILNSANNTAVAISLPTIGRELDILEYKLQWIISAYSLSSGCLLLVCGRLADLYGRKRTFLLGTICMAIFGLGCGFAQDEITIDVLRGFQGIGAAAFIPAALGILAHTFPPSRIRSIAFATFAAGAPVGAAIGSAIGGVLDQLTVHTWRSTFFFMTGLSVLCFLGGVISIDRDLPSVEADRRVDWIGAFLVTAGLTLIVFILSDGSIAPNGWKTGYIIAFIVVGVVLLALFIFWEQYLEQAQADPSRRAWWTPPPVMKVSIWTRANGKLAALLLVVFLEWCSFMSFQFWIQLFYQDYQGLSPVLTMVRLIPMFITGVCCNIVIALFVGRIDVVYLIFIGTLLTGVANLLFAVVNPAATFWAFGFPAAITSVFGADFVFASGTLFVAKVCLPHEQSVGGALFQTLTQLGTAFGIAISTIVFDATLAQSSKRYGVTIDKSGTNAPRPAQLDAYHDAMWTGFAFGILGTVTTLIFLRGVGIVGHQHPPKEEDARSDLTANGDVEKADGEAVKCDAV